MTEELSFPKELTYRGPYILTRIGDELRFVPAKKEGNAWVALSPEEVKEQSR